MKLQTLQFGDIEFDENIIIKFEDGILGFEDQKRFIMITEDDGIFYWLTSVDEPELVFPLFPLGLINDKYPVVENFEAFGIVNLDKDVNNITLNMKAPIYLNHGDKKGFQKILDKEEFPINYKLFVEEEDKK